MNIRFVLTVTLFSNLISFSSPLLADMQQDPMSGHFYSIPMSPDINQVEYNDLMQLCSLMCHARLMYSVAKDTNAETVSMLLSYLKKIGSPTSKRLMADIQKEAKRTA